MCAFCSYNFDVSFFSVQLTVTSTAAIIYVINCCSLFIRCNYTCIVGLLCLIPMLSSCACILSDVRVCGEGGPGVGFHDWTDMGGGATLFHRLMIHFDILGLLCWCTPTASWHHNGGLFVDTDSHYLPVLYRDIENVGRHISPS